MHHEQQPPQLIETDDGIARLIVARRIGKAAVHLHSCAVPTCSIPLQRANRT